MQGHVLRPISDLNIRMSRSRLTEDIVIASLEEEKNLKRLKFCAYYLLLFMSVRNPTFNTWVCTHHFTRSLSFFFTMLRIWSSATTLLVLSYPGSLQ